MHKIKSTKLSKMNAVITGSTKGIGRAVLLALAREGWNVAATSRNLEDLEALQEEGALSREDILDVTGLEPSQVPSVLLQLELNHKVQRSHDGKYVLKQPESGPSGYSDSHQK